MRRNSSPRSTARARSQFGLTANDIATNLNTSLSSSRAGLAEFLDRPEQRHPLLHRGADAGIRGELAQRPRAIRRSSTGSVAHPQSGAGLAQQRGDAHARQRSGQRQPGQHPAGLRGLCQRAGPRSRQHRRATSTRSSRNCRSSSRPAIAIQVIGQIESMNYAFRDLAIGLLFAAVFVYLLMVVNYQNFGDPFVVILALPATFCGIVTMLYITGTTLSVPVADGRDHGGRRRLGEFDPARHFRARAAARRQDRPSMPRSPPATPGSGRC